MKSFRIFSRTWWRENRTGCWPNGLEPCPGKRRYKSGNFDDEGEVRAKCDELNSTRKTAKQKRLGFKYEYTSEV